MALPKEMLGRIVLHTPAWLRSVRKIPLLGSLIHRISHQVLPGDQKIWAQIAAGPAAGLWLHVNPRVADSLIQGGTEARMQEALSQHLRPGMTFFDLGANIGLFTLLAARLVGEKGKVFSFEPDQENASRLHHNIARNGFTNVTVVEAGVWATTGELNFIPGPSSSPDRAWGKFVRESNGTGGVATPCVSLDDFVRDAPAPDGIKCDVEGAELEALRGAQKLLQKRHPWIVCETHSHENHNGVREFLSRVGYRIETLDDTHLLAH